MARQRIVVVEPSSSYNGYTVGGKTADQAAIFPSYPCFVCNTCSETLNQLLLVSRVPYEVVVLRLLIYQGTLILVN